MPEESTDLGSVSIDPAWASGSRTPLVETLTDAMTWARERDYVGWDYCDGLSTPIRHAIPGENRWVNLAIQEFVKRAPINVRPYLGVEPRRNFMGAALFAVTNLNLSLIEESIEEPGPGVDYAEETRRLCDWLVSTSISGFSGFCGGHNHPVQHLDSLGRPEDPDVVSTSYAVRALLSAAGVDEDYREVARTAERFLVEDMDYRENDDGAIIDYFVHQSPDIVITNAAAVGARALLDLHAAVDDPECRDRAEAILDYVVSLQADNGGWYYTHPPEKSHLGMDNHHNGFVIESLLRHDEVVGDGRYDGAVDDALEFYRYQLFEDDGAPRFEPDSPYPRDAHAAAQGILTFTYSGDYQVAERILGWTLEHLYDDEEGRFYYRKGRLITKRFTLMRWCQAWLCYAISEYLVRTRLPDETVPALSLARG